MDPTQSTTNSQGAPPPGGTAASGPPPKAFNEAAVAAKRPEGDTRSAQEIIDANPTLKNLGNQSGVKDNLKKQVGDFERDPGSADAADAAYGASEVLDHIKGSKTSEGKDRSGDVKDNGKIEGFTKAGDARHGTEAGLLQDFGKNGYSALKSDQTLDKTNDRHVKQDGTNMDNTTFAGREIVHGLSEAAGWINKTLNELPGPLKALLAPIHMASATASGGLNVAETAIAGGDVKQAGKEMASGVLNAGANVIKGVGELAGETLGRVPGVGKLISAGAETMTTAVSGGLTVADTAIQGGDVKAAAEKVGYDTAQTAVESAVGIVDPTGLGADAAGEAFRQGVDKKGGGSADGNAGGSPVDDLGGPSGKKGKGRASEDGGNAKGSVSADGGSPKGGVSGDGGGTRGGVSGDKNGATADRSPPKRTADDAGLPGRADADGKAQKTDNPSNGTHKDKTKEAGYLGITPGVGRQEGTHQSEHIVAFGSLHTNRKGNGDVAGDMPAYYEDTLKHRDHAGTDSHAEKFNGKVNGKPADPESQKYKDAEAEFKQKQADRNERMAWPVGSRYRSDQNTSLNDPVARKEGASLSIAMQSNQLGYAHQASHAARQPGQSRPAPDAKADASFENMVRKDPPLKHDVLKDPENPSAGMTTVEDKLGPRGQVEVLLAREASTTGTQRQLTPQERMDMFDSFNEIPGSEPKPARGNAEIRAEMKAPE